MTAMDIIIHASLLPHSDLDAASRSSSVSDRATAKEVCAALLGAPSQADGSYHVGFETAGAIVKEPAHDVGRDRLVATVTDPDGNVLGLLRDR